MSGAVDDSRLGETLRDLVVGSWLYALVTSAADAVGRTVENARLTRVSRTLIRWTRHSRLYNWLTTEPEPEVIVIDLRETYTIGPLIAGLDWLATRLGPRWRQSRWHRALHRGKTRIEPVVETVAESRVGGLLRALFVPPEPESGREDQD